MGKPRHVSSSSLAVKRQRGGNAGRCGTANIFLCVEPLEGKTVVKATEHRAKIDFAHFIRDLCDGPYRDSEKLVVVMDNLNTHATASLYEAFPPADARRLVEKLEIHYTPKHGSWLDIAEIELDECFPTTKS